MSHLHMIQSFRNSAPVWVLSEACSNTGFPQSHKLLQSISCCSAVGPPWAAGGSLLSHGDCFQSTAASPWAASGLQGNLCSGTWSPSCPSFTAPGSAGLFLSHSHTLLLHVAQYISHFLKYVITEVLPKLINFVQWQIHLGGVWNSVHHGRNFWCLLTEVAPRAFLISKSCHINPVQMVTDNICMDNILLWSKHHSRMFIRALGFSTDAASPLALLPPAFPVLPFAVPHGSCFIITDLFLSSLYLFTSPFAKCIPSGMVYV